MNKIFKPLRSIAIFMLFAICGIATSIKIINAQEVRYCQSTSRDSVNPVSAGVRRVVVAVNMYGNDIELPEPLKKENIESLLKELYEKRFSSFGGTILSTSTPGCHDRNDQPVAVIDLKQSGGWQKLWDASRDSETLSIMLHYHLMEKGFGGMDINSDFVTFYLSVMRPGVPEMSKNKSMAPFTIFTSTDSEKIEYLVRGVLEDRIKHQ